MRFEYPFQITFKVTILKGKLKGHTTTLALSRLEPGCLEAQNNHQVDDATVRIWTLRSPSSENQVLVFLSALPYMFEQVN